MKPRVVVVVQARTGSGRLPRKVLLPLLGEPLLLRQIERLKRSMLIDDLCVATTQHRSDDVLVELCKNNNINVVRGPVNDLLERHLIAARECSADVVVKVPSDCPLIDPQIVDAVLSEFLRAAPNINYVSNLHPATYPDGNDVEAISRSTLELAGIKAELPFQREHTTPWIWDANPDMVKSNIVMSNGRDYSMTHRWTIDYAEDYLLVKAVFEALYPINPQFTTADIIEFLEQHPEVQSINSQFIGVNWYRYHLHELKTIQPSETRYPQGRAL